MNKPVSFELAKLIKEKGFDKYGYLQNVWIGNKYEWRGKGKNKKSIEIPVWGLGSSSVLPTIADVCMWLYEKHGIWISVFNDDVKFFWMGIILNTKERLRDGNAKEFNSPTEAYSAAIEYTLKNLIK